MKKLNLKPTHLVAGVLGIGLLGPLGQAFADPACRTGYYLDGQPTWRTNWTCAQGYVNGNRAYCSTLYPNFTKKQSAELWACAALPDTPLPHPYQTVECFGPNPYPNSCCEDLEGEADCPYPTEFANWGNADGNL